MADRDDAALVRRAQAGDRGAFSELVQRYHQPLYRFLYRLTGSADEASDLTQETLVRAWQYLDRFDPARPWRPWLFQIAANRAASGRSRDQARPTVALDELPVDPPSDDNVEARIERHELSARLRAAIGELSGQQRQAIVLVELEGMTAPEAATVMGCSAATVRQHVFRGKKRLHALLAGYITGRPQAEG